MSGITGVSGILNTARRMKKRLEGLSPGGRERKKERERERKRRKEKERRGIEIGSLAR